MKQIIKIPKNLKDVEKLILNEVQEDLHLNYKSSPALDRSNKEEICKDVSAFANSDGGIIIYGVVEKNNLPGSNKQIII